MPFFLADGEFYQIKPCNLYDLFAIFPSRWKVLTDKPCDLYPLSFFLADGEFYRAVVTGKEGEGYQVTYLDFGDSATVDHTALRPFSANLLHDAPYSFQCTLAGMFLDFHFFLRGGQ